MESPLYSVTMLGEFTISYKSKQVFEQSNRSKKLWNVVEYLVQNRDRIVGQDELISLLWENKETGDNPLGALKVLIHRARKCLECIENVEEGELLKVNRGGYYWGPGVENTQLDVEVFEKTIAAADDESAGIEQRLELYTRAFNLYKGNFLQRNSEPWVIPLAEHYRGLYQHVVCRLVGFLAEKKRYREIIAISRKAISLDRLNERYYYYLIEALYKSGDQNEAMHTYSECSSMFYKIFGITPSDEMKDLYSIIQSTSHGMEYDINNVKEELREKDVVSGAFFCEFGFFKDMYRMVSRACSRSGDSVFLCLVTLHPTSKEEPSVKALNKAMEDAHEAITEALRKGDIFSRYSMSQFVILLPTTNFENVEIIMKRIASTYGRKHTKKDIIIQYKMQPLDPI